MKTATPKISLVAEGNVATNHSLINWTGKSFESEAIKVPESSFILQLALSIRTAKENLGGRSLLYNVLQIFKYECCEDLRSLQKPL